PSISVLVYDEILYCFKCRACRKTELLFVALPIYPSIRTIFHAIYKNPCKIVSPEPPITINTVGSQQTTVIQICIRQKVWLSVSHSRFPYCSLKSNVARG